VKGQLSCRDPGGDLEGCQGNATYGGTPGKDLESLLGQESWQAELQGLDSSLWQCRQRSGGWGLPSAMHIFSQELGRRR
jgi:hypothetical protein